MIRTLLNIAAALSLLLCLLAAILWLRSKDVEDYSVWRSFDRHDPSAMETRTYWLIYGDGGIQFSYMRNRHQVDPKSVFAGDNGFLHYTHEPPEYPESTFDGSETSVGGYGFIYMTMPDALVSRANWAGWSITSPLWAWVLVFAILPAVHVWVRHRKRSMRLHGLCAKCGYNLTGNVSGNCPE
jgi:hypothetical protein